MKVIPNWHQSQISSYASTVVEGGFVKQIFPANYWPGEDFGSQIEFALKYGGINLHILSSLFSKCPEEEIIKYVTAKPTGKYRRKIWYLYEFITGKRLPIDDLKMGNYVKLLDPDHYFTGNDIKISRQRIEDNLLSNTEFCPTVRKTKPLNDLISRKLAKICREVIGKYSESLIQRALYYLYRKETKASFEIEHETPSTSRVERFVSLLHKPEHADFFSKQSLIELQTYILDQRFANNCFRNTQNFVGQTIPRQYERIHYIPPKPSDVDSLMSGMIESNCRMETSEIDPVIHAAVISYGFVYIHPFDDGNGRTHRFLIHNILARRNFSIPGMLFPVSAVMLKLPKRYDASLEAFSKPFLELIDYTLSIDGEMTVNSDTRDCYRFMDLTTQAQSLFNFIFETDEVELPDIIELSRELRYYKSQHTKYCGLA